MGKQVHLLDDIQIKHWMKQGAPVAKSDGDGLTDLEETWSPEDVDVDEDLGEEAGQALAWAV